MKKIAAGLLILLATGAIARADTVVFKNGDKLTGTLVSITAGKLNLKTDALGQVAIALDKIQSFTTEMPSDLLTKENKALSGNVSLLPSGDWQITPMAGPPEFLGGEEVTAILPQKTYHELAEVPAKPWQDWKGNANLGYALQRGDQNTHALSAVIAAVRARPTDILFQPYFRTNFGLTMFFSEAEQDGVSITSNTITTNLREDYMLTPLNFVFGLAEFDHLDTQGLYLQQSYGGGYGRDLIHSARTTFSVLGGVTYVGDHYDSIPPVHSAEAFVGETLGSQLTSRIRVDEHFNFYPDVIHRGQYRFDGSAGLALKLTTHFTANAGLIDLYLTRVAPGSQKNNVTFTTGLGYAF